MEDKNLQEAVDKLVEVYTALKKKVEDTIEVLNKLS